MVLQLAQSKKIGLQISFQSRDTWLDVANPRAKLREKIPCQVDASLAGNTYINTKIKNTPGVDKAMDLNLPKL